MWLLVLPSQPCSQNFMLAGSALELWWTPTWPKHLEGSRFYRLCRSTCHCGPQAPNKQVYSVVNLTSQEAAALPTSRSFLAWEQKWVCMAAWVDRRFSFNALNWICKLMSGYCEHWQSVWLYLNAMLKFVSAEEQLGPVAWLCLLLAVKHWQGAEMRPHTERDISPEDNTLITSMEDQNCRTQTWINDSIQYLHQKYQN